MTVKTHLSKLSESNGDVSTRSQSKKCGDKKYVKHLKELLKKTEISRSVSIKNPEQTRFHACSGCFVFYAFFQNVSTTFPTFSERRSTPCAASTS